MNVFIEECAKAWTVFTSPVGLVLIGLFLAVWISNVCITARRDYLAKQLEEKENNRLFDDNIFEDDSLQEDAAELLEVVFEKNNKDVL